MKDNPPRRNAFIWAGIAVIGIIIVFIPSIIGLDGFDGGFAMSAGGIFVTIMGIVGAVIYARLAGRLHDILNNRDLLAHWKYTAEEWRRYTEQEHHEDAAARKGLFIMIAVVAVIVGTVFWAVKRDNAPVIFGTIGGIIVITGLAALISAQSVYRENKKRTGEAYLTLDGVYLNRQLHIWKGLGNRLEDIEYDEPAGFPPRISVAYSSPGTNIRNSYEVRIPVPTGEEARAKLFVSRIAEAHLNGNIRQ
jgi:hypothetical protein